MMSANDLTVDEERKEQAWTTLFIALGIIPNEESQHYEVTEVNG